jgi:diadenosine tetraphosphate (Ap4A) HIT family hydrolase
MSFLVGSGPVTDCLFCLLAGGDAEVSVVHRDERTVTFMDIEPAVSGHMIVVPRRHAASLADLDAEDGAQLFRVGQLAAAALRASELRCDGVNFHLADGEAAGQEVFHVHLHVFPRHTDDGFGDWFPPDYSVRPRSELDETAMALARAWPTAVGRVRD